MRTRIQPRFVLVAAVLFLASTACALPTISQGPTPASTPENAQTQAVKTIESMMTQVAVSAVTASPAAPNNPPVQTHTPVPVDPTLRPSSTPFPTITAVVLPQISPTSVCDQAGFISDVSIPDGSSYPVGATFDKTWKIKNTGTCTWAADYAIVFDSGVAMGSPAAQSLGKVVLPGETIDITIKLTAPSSPGKQRASFKLRNSAGLLFGIGPKAQTFYVEIQVLSITPVVTGAGYDLTNNYCLATWTGNDKSLACNGSDKDANGFVLYRSKPSLETGYIDDEPALLTNPPAANDAVIRGKYPAYAVKTGDHFKVVIGCEFEAKNCNVRFQLDYQIDNGTIQTLKSWNESYDSHWTVIDEDLSSLDGKNVSFILTVYANGASDQDRALWLMPRITR